MRNNERYLAFSPAVTLAVPRGVRSVGPIFSCLPLVVLSLFGEYTVSKHACARVHTPALLKMSIVDLVLMIPPIFLYTTDDCRIYQTIINIQTKLVPIFLIY